TDASNAASSALRTRARRSSSTRCRGSRKPHSRRSARGISDDAQRRDVARRDEQRRRAALAERVESLADAFDTADERDLVDERVRHLGRRLALLSLEEEVLDLMRLRLVAVAHEEIVVEVLRARAHAADVERVVLLQSVAR